MFTGIIGSLTAQLPGLLELYAFRALPIVGYAAVTRRISWRGKVLVAAAFACLLAAIRGSGGALFEPVVASGLGYGYYGLLACGAPWLSDRVRAGSVRHGAVFVLAAFFFVVAPLVLVPSSRGAPFHVVGWEKVLAYYSLTVETSRARRSLSIAECLFFMLVNPTLVYVERGQRFGEPAVRPGAALRVALGVCTVAAALVFLVALGHMALPDHLSALGLQAGYAAAVPFASTRFLAEYGAHSGVASIQIGLLALLGHRVPERYHYPLLANGPADFWRRWNIYVGSWFKRYVFLPLALERGRRVRGASASWSKGIALIMTFAAIGAFHDGFAYATRLVLTGEQTMAFLAWAAAILSWEGARRAWVALRPGDASRRSAATTRVLSAVSRLALAHVIAFVTLLYVVPSW